MTSPKPGWYPDPAGHPELYRWWDGARWTDEVSPSAKAPAPFGPQSADAEDELDLRPRRASPGRLLAALALGLVVFVTAGLGVGAAL